ncbi:MAG: hypothetical protein H6581_09765 [Bacteroidia bacterium]|nr:hypothetical protein [Bacteroidia bacterium]
MGKGKVFSQNLPQIANSKERNLTFFRNLVKVSDEPVLSKKSGCRTQVRLTLLRSLDPTVIIRVDDDFKMGFATFKLLKGKRPPKLIKNRLAIFEEFNQNGSPIYKPASLALESKTNLNAEMCDQLRDSLHALNFFQKPHEKISRGVRDGSVWVLEVFEEGNYHFYAFRPEDDLKVSHFCRFLIELSQGKIDNLY